MIFMLFPAVASDILLPADATAANSPFSFVGDIDNIVASLINLFLSHLKNADKNN